MSLSVFLSAPSASAGYRDLARELEAYEPTPLYRAYAEPRPAADLPRAAAPGDFEAQVAALRAAQERWAEALTARAPDGRFFAPDPALTARLSPAAAEPGAAAAALADGFTLETLEALALLRNPGVRAAAKSLRASLERYDQASNLDEILRQYTAFTEAVMPGVGPMKGREPVEMRFPFPGVLALKGQVVGQEVAAAAESLEIARRTAVTGARRSYWNLAFVGRAVAITREMTGLLGRLEAVVTARYETGKTSFQDVIKVRIRRETLDEDLRTLVEKDRTLGAKVRELLDLAPGVPVGTPAAREADRRVPDLEPLYALAGERRQELRRMRAMVGKMERMIELAETRMLPAYTLGLAYFQDEAVAQVGTARMREPFAQVTTASVGAGLPKMPWYGTNDAYLRETRQKLGALRDELVKAESMTRFGVRDAWAELDQAAREERLYGESVVGLSEAALEVSTRGYETGKVMFADLIASYQSWLMARLTLERKRADLGVARAELEAAVGVSPLPRNGN
ncbi:MAG: TolC family protein [Deferrisomatales bacterium]